RLLQDHRSPDLSHGPDPSSLRTQGVGRAKGNRALLDHYPAARAGGPVDPEIAMNGASHPDPVARALGGGPARAVVVGLGITGLSVARFLLRRGIEVAVTDSRSAPPETAALGALAAQTGRVITLRAGAFDAALLEHADFVVVSPGVAIGGPFFEA